MLLHGKVLSEKEKFAEQFTDFAMADRSILETLELFILTASCWWSVLRMWPCFLKQTYKSLLFIPDSLDSFVGLAVISKPSNQPIWLRV